MAPRSEDRKFDVALSFAGEQRSYVEEVAAGLRHRGIRVFYDKYEEANLWGKDLYEHLHEVYGDAAEYCVIFASEAYKKKVWTTHERKSAQERALSEHREYVLPARFDDTKIPGIMDTVGYIDLKTHIPEELVSLIVEKLGPLERRDFFPRDLSRLFSCLGTEDGDKPTVAEIAGLFFSEFAELTGEEREIVFTIFSRGCPGAMPENMHIHVEKIRRWLGIDSEELAGILKRMSPFGFRYTRYRDASEEADEDNDEMVSLNWIDLSVRDGNEETAPDEEFVMSVAVATIELMADGRCDDCIRGVIERCDFSPLGVGEEVEDL